MNVKKKVNMSEKGLNSKNIWEVVLFLEYPKTYLMCSSIITAFKSYP